MNIFKQLLLFIMCGPDTDCTSCGERSYWNFEKTDHETICGRCDSMFDLADVEWVPFTKAVQ